MPGSGDTLPSSPADALVRFDRRPKLFFAAATLGILLLVLALSILDLWALRRRTLAQAEKRAINVSLVLMSDIEMPGEDGYQLATRALARAREKGARLNTVAVTAYARADDRARALEHGFDWHLSKPVEPSELVSIIASLAYAPASDSRPN